MNYDSLVVYLCVQFATDHHFCGFSAVFTAAAVSGFKAEMLRRNESMGAGMSVAGERHRELCGSSLDTRFIRVPTFPQRKMTIQQVDYTIYTRYH